MIRLVCPYCDCVAPEGNSQWLTLSLHIAQHHWGSSSEFACPCGELFVARYFGFNLLELHLQSFGLDGYRDHILQSEMLKQMREL